MKSKERPEGMRDRLYKEWCAESKPSIGERTAYWAGFYRGHETGVYYMEYFKKNRKKV